MNAQRYYWRSPIRRALLLAALMQNLVSCSHLPPIPSNVTFNTTVPKWSWTGIWKGDGGSVLNIVQQGNTWVATGDASGSASLQGNRAIGSVTKGIASRNFDLRLSDDGMWAMGSVIIGNRTISNTKLMRISGAPQPLTEEQALLLNSLASPSETMALPSLPTTASQQSTISAPPAGLYRGYMNKTMGFLPDTGMNIVLDKNGSYTDGINFNNVGRYTFDPANRSVSFTGGPWNGTVAILQINPRRIRLQPTEGKSGAIAGIGNWWFDLDMKTTTATLPQAVVPDLNAINPLSHVFTVDEIIALNDANRFHFLSHLQGRPIRVSGIVTNKKLPSRYFDGIIWLGSETYPGGNLSFNSGKKILPPFFMQAQIGQTVTVYGIINQLNKNIRSHIFFDLLGGKIE